MTRQDLFRFRFNHPTIYRLTDCHHRWAKSYRLQTPSRIRPHNVGNRFLLPNILMRRKRFAITITQIRWYHQLFSIEMSGNKKRLPDLPGYNLPSYRVPSMEPKCLATIKLLSDLGLRVVD